MRDNGADGDRKPMQECRSPKRNHERGQRITVLKGWEKEDAMATQIVMDHSGDTRHDFSPLDAEALADAERRFKELTGRGFTAAVRTGPGEVALVQGFDPTANETVFFPRIVGG